MHGAGSMNWPNGAHYDGSYQKDAKHGEGTIRWPDGRVYRGHWFDGELHGDGVMIDREGNVSPRQWFHGVEKDASALRQRLQEINRRKSASSSPRRWLRSPCGLCQRKRAEEK